MHKRPLLKAGIDELDRLFENHRTDAAFLKTILKELKNRKTQRAQDLLARVETAVAELARASTPVIEPEASETKSPPPRPAPTKDAHSFDEDIGETVETKLASVSEVNGHPDLPANILAAWTCMEVLSPPAFRRPEDLVSGDRFRIANIEGRQLPWEMSEKSRPNYRLYYQIVLGTIRMDAAVSALLATYSDSRDERPASAGDAVLATVMVDKDGRLVDTDPISVSSFAWGVPVALEGKLGELSRWSKAEPRLIEQLTSGLSLKDEDGNPLPLTRERIESAYAWLVQKLGLSADLVRPPTFVVRSYQYFKFQDPPEAILLNSFFLDDLGKAAELERSGRSTGNLQRYLQAVAPATRANLLRDRSALREAIEPQKFPLASWPSQGRNALALLQQCAVNTIATDLKSEGIVAVNGPPGTGKTTLLRDVIAANIAVRASVLCKFQDPEEAFRYSGQKIRTGGVFVHLYTLDEKIRGYEMLVASSNNRAVENVSAELPASEAVASDTPDLRYFKTTSDAMLGRDTWGAVAAVLGNAKNRGDFRQKFWWDEDTGLQKYLQHASGTPQFIVEETAKGPKQRYPNSVQREGAPSDHDEALRAWKRVRQRYKKASKLATDALADIQKLQQAVFAIENNTALIPVIEAELDQLRAPLTRLAAAGEAAAAEVSNRRRLASEAEQALSNSLGQRPGWIARLFNLTSFKLWSVRHDQYRRS